MMTVYSYQRKVERLTGALTRHELIDDIVSLNALAESVVIRIARLSDKRKDARSVSMLLKRGSLGAQEAATERIAEEFRVAAEPVLKIRHEKIAHMKPGTLSSYRSNPLPPEAVTALEKLVALVDCVRSKTVKYHASVGSQEGNVDLRASLQQGKRVAV
jgi:hypothetical protein